MLAEMSCCQMIKAIAISRYVLHVDVYSHHRDHRLSQKMILKTDIPGPNLRKLQYYMHTSDATVTLTCEVTF